MAKTLQSGLVLIIAALAVTGCDAPDPSFTYNNTTHSLVADVQKAVKAEVDDKFGTPLNPVAWERMPVDYGSLAGTVSGYVEDKEGTYRLQVEFDETEDAPDVEEINFRGLGLVWKSGAYAAGAQIDGGRRDGEKLYSLQVTGYDAESEQPLLSLGHLMSKPPASGDKFEIVGYKLSWGRQLYAAHCQHCHGVGGDGNGPTAKYLKPKPRDYRVGKFKFKSTERADRPSDDDLERIVRKGIPGTYMPSFLLLEEGELDAIVQYVKWLSMRGEYELALANKMAADYEAQAFDERIESILKNDLKNYKADSGADRPTRNSVREAFLNDPSRPFAYFAEDADASANSIQGYWAKVQDPSTAVLPSVARTPDSPESRGRGRVAFMKNCAACHGATGRGDGEQVEAYTVNEETKEKYPEPGLFDDWGQPIKPRDLTRGIYRGGRRPLDLYRRIHEGINGTPMIPFKGKIPDPEIWDLVNYVYSIPFENRTDAAKKSPAEPERTAAAER